VDLSSYPRAAEDISGAAVTSLVTQARELLATDRLDQAAATLERALRIEPRNAFVWSLLAQTQLRRDNYEQAESVAQKANSLARGNPYVELENWRVIAAARSGRGDAIGALQAQDRAQALEARLQAVSP
jgi:tetratricopeptide (TPR) repeat protein